MVCEVEFEEMEKKWKEENVWIMVEYSVLIDMIFVMFVFLVIELFVELFVVFV